MKEPQELNEFLGFGKPSLQAYKKAVMRKLRQYKADISKKSTEYIDEYIKDWYEDSMDYVDCAASLRDHLSSIGRVPNPKSNEPAFENESMKLAEAKRILRENNVLFERADVFSDAGEEMARTNRVSPKNLEARRLLSVFLDNDWVVDNEFEEPTPDSEEGADSDIGFVVTKDDDESVRLFVGEWSFGAPCKSKLATNEWCVALFDNNKSDEYESTLIDQHLSSSQLEDLASLSASELVEEYAVEVED